MKSDKCPPFPNLYYGLCVDCYCPHQKGKGIGAGMESRLVTIFKDGRGHPTRAEKCPKLQGEK